MTEFRNSVSELLRIPKVSLGELQSFAGRADHIANLLIAWRPLISELWGAIYVRRRVGQRIRIKQVLHTLRGLDLLMAGHMQADTDVELEFVAESPDIPHDDSGCLPLWIRGWGVLIACDKIIAFFACPLTTDDEHIHGHLIGADTGQQVWEALCILVAMRTWSSYWLACQCSLTIKSDNVSALVMASKLKITSSELIARELALLLSEASYMPRHVVHVPGVMNAWADALSRLSEPGGNYRIPAALRSVPRSSPIRRSPDFYSTLAQ